MFYIVIKIKDESLSQIVKNISLTASASLITYFHQF